MAIGSVLLWAVAFQGVAEPSPCRPSAVGAAAAEEAARSTADLAIEGIDGWEGLRSPYYEVRRDSERRLQHLPSEAADGLCREFSASSDPLLRRAAAGWLVSHLKGGGTCSAAELVDKLEREADASVIDRLIDACIHHPDALGILRERFAAKSVPGAVLDRVADGRMILLLGEVMHEGRIPGFFDGQFAAALAMDPTAYGRLAYMAWNPRIHFTIRALSIMALHEAKRPDLEGVLSALVIDPEDEVEIQKEVEMRALRRALGDVDYMRVARANLSQYARFSMAKGGVSGPIEEKIAYMERWATRRLQIFEAYDLDTMDDNGSPEWEFEDAMSMVFEVGYHYQQLDAYAQAEQSYRRVIDRPEPLRTKRWAYYNLACIRALQGNADDAIAQLRAAFATGLGDPAWALRDGDLVSLHDDPRFQELIADVLAGRTRSAADAREQDVEGVEDVEDRPASSRDGAVKDR